MRFGRRLTTRALTTAMLLASPVAAAAQTVRITNLSDVSFGTVSLGADITRAQTVCAYSTAVLSTYSVTATGSGSGGAFTLANGGATLPYQVQWSQNSGATSGTQLTAGVALSGQASLGVTTGCVLGILPSGSLIVILRANDIQTATAGDYSGTLTIMLSAN